MSVSTAASQGSPTSRRSLGRATRAMRVSPRVTIGLVLFSAIVLLCVLGPLFMTDTAGQVHLTVALQSPSGSHPFGTDSFGRDLLSRVAYGGRATLMISAVTALLVTLIGVPIGIVAGYFGRWADLGIMRVVELAFAMPPLVLAIAVVAFVGSGSGNVIIALTVVYVPLMARVARAATLTTRRMPFIEAARAIGDSDARIMVQQVAPNISAPVAVEATLVFAFALLAEASLSFLGLGTQEPRPSWGLLLHDAIPLVNTAPWLGIFPGVFIAAVVLSLNFVSDGLREILDVAGRRAGEEP